MRTCHAYAMNMCMCMRMHIHIYAHGHQVAALLCRLAAEEDAEQGM